MRSATLFACAAAALISGQAVAQELYNNWNTDACELTDRAGFVLSAPTKITSVELWYRWGRDESEVGYALYHNGRFVRSGRLMRAGCDPYQERWCGARGSVGVNLPPGEAEFRVERPKVCQNGGSGGEGFIHAFGMQR